MDKDLLKRIKRQDRFLRKLLFMNDPEDSIKHRLKIMKSLVVQIPRELSDLAKYWSTKLSLHKSVYKSSLLLPPLREPLQNPQAVGPVPVVVAAAPKIVHKSTASSVQPKKSVIFDKVYVYLFGPERSKARAKQQQAETTNLEGSQSPDSQTVESILKFVCDHHHCSSCNDFDAMKYEIKQSSSLNGGNRLSGATSSSTRAIDNQIDHSKKTSSNYAANSIVPTATSSVQTDQGNLFVQRSLKRASQALDQSIVPGSSSSTHNIGHDPSKKKFTPATTPSTALTTSNQTDQDSSFVQRSLKRTSQTLMDHSIAPGSSSSASLHQPEKRSRTSNNEPLRSKLMALVSAIPPMNDYRDIEYYKSLLRTVRKVLDHLKGASMEDPKLEWKLMQMFIDKLHVRARFHLFNRDAFKRNAVHPSYYLYSFEHFIKHQLTYYIGELIKKATAFGDQLAQNRDILYRIYCGYCKRDTNHSIGNCPVRKMVNSARICFHCLEDEHLMAYCPKMRT